MNHKIKDLKGLVFNKWTVIKYIGKNNENQPMWLCVCECGKEQIVRVVTLSNGTSKSCGCSRYMMNKTHGQSINNNITPEYNAWNGMKDRCYNVSNRAYKNYGGRGIKVCKRWLTSFENFFDDMGKRPNSNYSLDRYPNNNGNYIKSNCRWATIIEQASNRRTNKFITHNGIKKIQAEWARELNMTPINLSISLKTKTLSEIFEYRNKKHKVG